jgi:TPP-dependent indolepyruvate ferredoxin oxidoreductase alpha subunit
LAVIDSRIVLCLKYPVRRRGVPAPGTGNAERDMAERSFAKEVRDLELGEGQTFRGEGILAITKALLQSGVGYVGGYQGAPISHLMDVLSDSQDLLAKLGIQFSASASEAAAAASLAASMMYPIRGAVTFKSTVGTNVAADALANLASSGVTGGALIIVGEDYGEGSSIMQERSHAFAMKSQIWLLDPRPNLESIVKAVEDGFALSEASNTPVMLEVRIRACHVHGSFIAKDNKSPSFTLKQALEHPRRDVDRIVLPPASYLQEKEKVDKRWPAAVAFIKRHKLNEVFAGDLDDVGIILQGGMYNGVVRALQRLDLANIWGNTRVPLYVMNVTYPLVHDEIVSFCADKRAVLVVEEGQPEFIEQAVNSILRKKDVQTKIYGKDVLPMAGEYTAEVMLNGLRGFLNEAASNALSDRTRAPNVPAISDDQRVKALTGLVPPRPPGFCIGCPERPIFAAMKLVEQELGPHHVAADNYYASATGGQDLLSSRAENASRSTKHPITKALEGVGATWVKQIDRTYDVAKMRDTLKAALTSSEPGPKVIVASSECMLNRQRREKPLFNQAVKRGERKVRERYGVDEDVCTGDHACIRLSGCPSLSIKHTDDPLKDDPVAAVDNGCVGCGNCGEVADAAVLCPSFYRADIIHNPTRVERAMARLRARVIGWLQGRRARRQIAFT